MPDVHPVVSLLEKVLAFKVQKLRQKKGEEPPSPTLKEGVECSNCEERLGGEEGYFCESCMDYVLCGDCHGFKGELHP